MAEINSFISAAAKKEVAEYETSIKNLVIKYGKLASSATTLQTAQSKQVTTQKELDNQTTAYNSLLKQLNTTSGKLQVAESNLNKTLLEQKAKLAALTAEQKAKIAVDNTEKGSIANLTAQNKLLIIQRNKLSTATEAERQKIAQLNTQINSNNAAIRTSSSTMEQHRANVGNYSSALNGLRGSFANVGTQILGSLGIVGGVTTLINLFKNAISTSNEYESANTELASVLGTTYEGTEKLRKSSEEYGASTAFSATQVVQLQTELARLGKSEDEIIGMTQGIINASVALNSSVADTAKLVASSLNAWDLGATESGRVADVLTLSTQKTALSFTSLNTALPIVAGSASAAGVTLEEVAAQLGQAADRGIDASTSATSLRNIYITLASKGLKLDDALQDINNSQSSLTTATELFGKRAATTALALATNITKTKKLTSALKDASGAAKEVSETRLKSMKGKLTLLSSAWEGLTLTVFNSESAFGEFLKGVVDVVTAVLSFTTTLIKGKNAADVMNTAVDSLNKQYKTEKDVLDNANEARILLISNLEDEGLSYAAAKIAADDYLATLKFINSELGKNVESDFKIFQLKSEIEILEAAGAQYEIIAAKKIELANLEDKQKYAKIELNEATDDELQQYLELENSYLQISDAAEVFLDKVRAEIALRAELAAALNGDLTANKSLIDIQKELLAIAKKMPEFTEAEIAMKNTKIDAINEEIKRLQDLKLATEDIIDVEKIRREQSAETLTDAEEGAQKTFELGAEKATQEQEAAQARVDLEAWEKEQLFNIGVTNLANVATLASGEAGINKAYALKNAIFDGYAAVQSVFAETPGPLPIKIAAAAVAGAVQLKNVNAILTSDSDISAAYADGTDSTTSGTWLAGEAGREMLLTKDGKMGMINEPTLFSNAPGHTVLSNPDTERILRGDAPAKRVSGIDTDKIVAAIKANSPKMSMGIDKYGIITIGNKGRSTTEVVNKKFRHRN